MADTQIEALAAAVVKWAQRVQKKKDRVYDAEERVDAAVLAQQNNPQDLDAQVALADARVALADARVALADARVALADARVALAEAEVNHAKAKVALADTGHNSEERREAKTALAKAEVALAKSEVALAEAKVALAKAEHGISSDEYEAAFAFYKTLLTHFNNAVGKGKEEVEDEREEEAESIDWAGVNTFCAPIPHASKAKHTGFDTAHSPASDPAALIPLIVSGHLVARPWKVAHAAPTADSAPSPAASSTAGAMSIADLHTPANTEAGFITAGLPHLVSTAQSAAPNVAAVARDVVASIWSLCFSSESQPINAGLNSNASGAWFREGTFVSNTFTALARSGPAFLDLDAHSTALHEAFLAATAYNNVNATDIDGAIFAADRAIQEQVDKLEKRLAKVAAGGSGRSNVIADLKAELAEAYEELAAATDAARVRAMQQRGGGDGDAGRVEALRRERQGASDPSESFSRAAAADAGVTPSLRTTMWHEKAVSRAWMDVLFGCTAQYGDLGFGIYEPGRSTNKDGQTQAYGRALGITLLGFPLGLSLLALHGPFPETKLLARSGDDAVADGAGLAPAAPAQFSRLYLDLDCHLVLHDSMPVIPIARLPTPTLYDYAHGVAAFASGMALVTQTMVTRIVEPTRAPRRFGRNVSIYNGYAYKWFLDSSNRRPNETAWVIGTPELVVATLAVAKPFETRRGGEGNVLASHKPGETAVLITKAPKDYERDGCGTVTVGHFADLFTRLRKLHAKGWVFGDVRRLNVVFTSATIDGVEEARGYLIDYDFARCGEEELFYPFNVSHNISDGKRHADAKPGWRMLAAHDIFSLAAVMALYSPVSAEEEGKWQAAVSRIQAAAAATCDDADFDSDPVVWPAAAVGLTSRIFDDEYYGRGSGGAGTGSGAY